jgi:hypothetical protein
MYKKELLKSFSSVDVLLYGENYLYFDVKEGAYYDLEEMIAVTEFMWPYAVNGRRLFITDMRKSFLRVSEEAMEWNANYEPAKTLKIRNAILVNNLFMRSTVNFFIRLKKPMYPAKSFTSLEKGIRWLNEQN